MAWILSSSPIRLNIAFFSMLAMGLRLAFVPCFTDIRVVTFSNLLCTFSSCFKMLRTPGSDDEMFGMQPFLLFEIMVCALIIAFSQFLRLNMLEDLRKEAIAKRNGIEHSALKMLLEHVFDVVLPLDSNFCISGNEEKLASLLMLDRSRCRKGANIQDFMSSQADRDRFRKQFKAKSSEASPVVSCLNVRMRDGNPTNISFEVYSVAVASFDASATYWIGVREFADCQFNPHPIDLPQPPPASNTSSLSRSLRHHGTPSQIVGVSWPSGQGASLTHQSRTLSALDTSVGSRSICSSSEAQMQNAASVSFSVVSEDSRCAPCPLGALSL
eukprot:TRINITY_DN4828_c0_g1_i6.p1 TRINITY_DN4828_c0_g1~~TRINITY_DN4828_c0_g1_i6.p1  ORF type:complete len:348 (+),score=32.04 TRINITY_DN4828_c0_g1_i6:63-1046(+)